MVSGIKARSFEDDPDWLIYLLQGLLAALRAASQWLVVKGLLLIELDSAVGTAVCIDWHAYIFFLFPRPITGG